MGERDLGRRFRRAYRPDPGGSESEGIDEEIRFYLDRRTDELIAEGRPPAEARRRALAAFGDPRAVSRECRRISKEPTWERGRRMMGSVWQDIRFGLRSFARRPTFTLGVTLTLALGLGATTTAFSVVDAALMRPLPFDEPERLVLMGMDWSGSDAAEAGGVLRLASASIPNFVDWRESSTSFEAMGGLVRGSVDLTGGLAPERAAVGMVTRDFFPALGKGTALGRLFSPEEHSYGNDIPVVLSHALWLQRYGADSDILGTTLETVGESYQVVGVLSADALLPEALGPPAVQLWMPLQLDDPQFSDRNSRPLDIVARLRPGVGLESAREEMDAVAMGLAEAYPDVWVDPRTGDVDRIGVAPLLRQTVGSIRGALLTGLGSVGLLLLIACANVANLFLARGVGRTRELAVRTALGAGRTRVIRQLLTESILLSGMGGLMGIALSVVGLDALRSLAPAGLPRLAEAAIDLRVLAFAAGLTVTTGIVFGLLPAYRAAMRAPGTGLRNGSPGSSWGQGSGRMRRGLVVVQTGLSVVLLTGAGLLMNSFVRLRSVDPGLAVEGLVELRLRLRGGFETAEEHLAFYQALGTKLGELPGVVGVAATVNLPVGDTNWRTGATTAGGPHSEEPLIADGIPVSPGYFEVAGIEVLEGREFLESDSPDVATVIVNQALAEAAFPGGNAVGQTLRFGNFQEEAVEHTIVGVVANVRQAELTSDYLPAMFVSWSHFTWPTQSFVIRFAGDPSGRMAEIREAVWDLDPTLPVPTVRTVEERIRSTIVSPRFYAALLGTFALVALALASVGIYATTACSVRQREREVGVRLALGAGVANVASLMLKQEFAMVALGLLLGTGAALLASRVLESALFGISSLDPWTHGIGALLLGLVGALACWAPTRAATRVDPASSLRAD